MLRDRLMIAKCSISLWGAERKDKTVEAEVAQAKHVKKGKAGRWATNLLAGADAEYEALKGALGAVRDFHYENTLRWDHGEQALPNERFLAYAKGMGILKGIAEQRVEDLVQVWDERVRQAQENSEELTRKFSYPSASELKHLCGVRVEIRPMPESGDLILDVSNDEARKLLEAQKIEMDSLATTRVDEAKKDLFGRLKTILSLAKRNLETPGRYRDNWYDHLMSFAESSSEMNFDKDQRLTDLVEDAKILLEKPKDEYDRKDNPIDFEAAREAAASKVDEILGKMVGIF